MTISQILNSNKLSISYELFPPKQGSAFEKVHQVSAEIAALKPSYISVTCGAGGNGGTNTIEIVDYIQNQHSTPALAHLTCIGAKKCETENTLDKLKSLGIRNILALRGDLPSDIADVANDYRYASDLIEHIKRYGDFCVGGACYPEGHPEAKSLAADIESLKIKEAAGCSFLVSQMFFDNSIIYNFMYRMLSAGVHIPVVPGVMPVTNIAQITRICQMTGTVLPPRFRAIVEKFAHSPEAMKQAGIAYATEQIIDLMANGFNNIHVYAMNKPDIATAISSNLSHITTLEV